MRFSLSLRQGVYVWLEWLVGIQHATTVQLWVRPNFGTLKRHHIAQEPGEVRCGAVRCCCSKRFTANDINEPFPKIAIWMQITAGLLQRPLLPLDTPRLDWLDNNYTPWTGCWAGWGFRKHCQLPFKFIKWNAKAIFVTNANREAREA